MMIDDIPGKDMIHTYIYIYIYIYILYMIYTCHNGWIVAMPPGRFFLGGLAKNRMVIIRKWMELLKSLGIKKG